ncbi:unnamed protein product [Dibothriocephalus latus]|uniref:Leucine carboxyl methyltransferase 1 n=1 Tax=Dibothriocephalus latus TaxID=60516 RepID=A0A3P7LXL6_DIBLA|nr:unnamed protein product [Dibothriocephalus latus]
MDQVQCTNDEATASKAHSIRRGYWVDPYTKYFCPIPSAATPEISRGYFVRVQTFEAMTRRFIQACPVDSPAFAYADFNGQCHVVNLGAGSDTLFFRLKSAGVLPKAFVEVDLPGNVKKKIITLRSWHRLEGSLKTDLISFETPPLDAPPQSGFTVATPDSYRSLNAAPYFLLNHDLRLPPASLIEELCTSEAGPKLSPELPTLFLAECVLVYIPTASSEALIKTLASHFTSAAFINYEQVNMNDKFGEIMVRSFRDRSCELPGLSACGSIDDQKQR